MHETKQTCQAEENTNLKRVVETCSRASIVDSDSSPIFSELQGATKDFIPVEMREIQLIKMLATLYGKHFFGQTLRLAAPLPLTIGISHNAQDSVLLMLRTNRTLSIPLLTFWIRSPLIPFSFPFFPYVE